MSAINTLLEDVSNTNKYTKYIEESISSNTAIAVAKFDNNIKQFNDNIEYCIYKTKFKDKDAVKVIFNIDLMGIHINNQKSITIIMKLVDTIERKLSPIVNWNLIRTKESTTLTIVKIL